MSDLTKKKDNELRELIAEKKRALQDLDFSLGKSKPGSVTHRGLRREIARIYTELQARSNNDS